ncbi:cyclophilin-like domain-containing protein, partial [Sphaerosporella brunnea]
SAKVVLKTNFGDLELELWGQQTPLTTRNFLQLCYDGYYNDTVFHRLVAGFILQGGDPTGTGHGGEAIYPGGLFADEFHPRLKYNRRGLVGMANSGKKDDNGSQFFLTLGDTKELTGKNTLFGKIVGDTVYNLVRMGEMEVEEGTERPVFPPKIISAEVLVNPFDDVKPRETKRKAEVLEKEKPKKPAPKKKSGKQLLSFAGDDEEDGIPTAPLRKKPKFDTRLVVAGPEQEKAAAPNKHKEMLKGREKPQPAAQKGATLPPPPPSPKPKPPKATTLSPSRSPTPPPPSKAAQRLAETNAQIAALKKSLRRSLSPPPPAPAAPKEASGKKKSLLAIQKAMLPPTSIQGRKKKHRKEADDSEAFAALQKFREKLASAPSSRTKEPSSPMHMDSKNAPEDQDTEAALCDLHFIPNCQSCSKWDAADEADAADGGGGDVSSDLWSHTLSFEKDRLGKDLSWKAKNEELVVIDPREKQREIMGKRKGGDRDRGRDRGESGVGAVALVGGGGRGGGGGGRGGGGGSGSRC